jgi:hypothetical protein
MMKNKIIKKFLRSGSLLLLLSIQLLFANEKPNIIFTLPYMVGQSGKNNAILYGSL